MTAFQAAGSALVIVNPFSGPKRRRSVEVKSALARDVLSRHGLAVEVAVTNKRGHGRELSRQARDRGMGIVVAWGGDGTINEVASGLVGSDVALGIVPGGSGNGLARDLGIPLDPAGALEIVGGGRTRRIDSGRIDDDVWFFNIAGVGLDALISHQIAQPGAQRGFAGYIRLTFGELPWYRPQLYRVDCDGEANDRHAMFIAFANSRQYGNDAKIAPAARLDDGLLDVVVVEAQPLWRILSKIPHLFQGRLKPGRGLHMHTMTAATIESARPIAYHADGEPGAGGTSLRVTVVPASLSVRAPVN